jgi:hypothetical protein
MTPAQRQRRYRKKHMRNEKQKRGQAREADLAAASASRPMRIRWCARQPGWRKPEGAIYVGRPSRWGNPFRVGAAAGELVARYRAWLLDPSRRDGDGPSIAEIRRELRGRDLDCWCDLDQPCHADVLLEVVSRQSNKTTALGRAGGHQR